MNFTREELAGKSKLELKSLIKQSSLDVAFTNMTSHPELVEAIMQAQEKRDAAAPPPAQEEAPPVGGRQRGRARQQLEEDQRPPEEDAPPPPPNGNGKAKKKIRVACGASSGQYPVAGMTVGNIRQELRDILNIGSEHMPRVNGASVDNDYVLKEEDSLEFVRNAGDKA
ncbi:TPA: hypothetical protein DEP34_03725 [Candidatus Uhrbacteria bacterium]|uniref:Uncharacterized protein n=1 Tax=Candidatus Uhrbacteria bacterium GW2011_GWE2_46_68 TaxID=1618994 RepID=A0A0G1SE35_9BACT|nr:MAG: hypothetical protein UX57_C0018G0012 [Candidatus Uhrbacteria bacterium GW2011_GWE2_46_68]HBK34253.1 hypothetical protein [Candidatus Uhrbacteria bacterium]HCB19465.1 hypothetical protein [Candidatus Uhrbacteria bacterium]